MEIPGDVSAAAFWIVAGLCHPDAEIVVKNIGINKSRTGFLEILKNMGADITILNKHMMSGEPVGDIKARSRTRSNS
jgi:3-phosphoshikimate 1-carboxyvinyltransferase